MILRFLNLKIWKEQVEDNLVLQDNHNNSKNFITGFLIGNKIFIHVLKTLQNLNPINFFYLIYLKKNINGRKDFKNEKELFIHS